MRHLPKIPRLRYVVANMAWQLGHDAAALRAIAQYADVLGLVECRTKDNKPLDVGKILGKGWRVFQDLSSAARAGAVCAVRVGVKVRRSTLKPLSDAGHKVQERFQRLTVIVDHGIVDTIVGHNPLPSTGRFRQAENSADRMVSGARKRRRESKRPRRWVWMGDANTMPGDWAEAIAAPFHYGFKPMVICWSAGWGDVTRSKFRVRGSDHWVLGLQQKAAA